MRKHRLEPGWSKPQSDAIPPTWKPVRLATVSRTVAGGRLGLTKERDYRTSGVPAFSAAGQDGYVDEAEFQNTDAVVLSSVGANCGRCFLAEGAWTTLANVQAIITGPEVSARYLQHRVNRDDYWPRSGSAQPFIKPSDIGRCWLALPPLPEQRLIAEILDSIDEAIRKTEEIIAKLKQVKQGLLHDLLTRGIDDNGELRDPDRHPEQFKDSPLGRIPSCWDVQPLSAVCDAVIDCKNRTPPLRSSGHVVVRTSNVRQGEFVSAGLVYTDPASYEIWTAKGKPRAGDVLITREAPVGEVCLLPKWLGDACLGQRMMMCRPDPQRMHNGFMVVALQSGPVQKTLVDWAGGSTVGHVRVGDMRRLPIQVPSILEQVAIATMWDGLRWRMNREGRLLGKLRLMKQGLMEDLLTGRVRVTPLLDSQAEEAP